MAGCAAVVALAANLSWASIGEFTVRSIGGDDVAGGPRDGIITLILAPVGLGVGLAPAAAGVADVVRRR